MPNSKFGIDWWLAAATQTPEPIAFMDAQGRFVWCNNALCRLLGYSLEEVCRKRWRDITSLGDLESLDAEMASLRDSNRVEFYLEQNYERKDGEHVNIGLYVHRHPEFGSIKGYIVFVREMANREGMDALRKEFEALGRTVTEMQNQATRSARLEQWCHECNARTSKLEAVVQAVLSGKGNSVTVTGDVTGRDKTNTPREVLLWIILAVFGLGVVVMGGKLYVQATQNTPGVSVESPQR